MGYEVKNWKPGSGQTKGYFTLVYNDIEVNDCRLVTGQHGDFVSFPQRKYIDKDENVKYAHIVFMPDKDRRQAFNTWAVGELSKFVQADTGGEACDDDNSDVPF